MLLLEVHKQELITIDPRAAQKIQPELMTNETIYWAGMPNPHVIFHSDDWQTILFSTAWLGFAVFFEGHALGYWATNQGHDQADPFLVLWGIPFFVFGNYMLWGWFLVDAWLKRRTYYAVTNRRVLILQDGWHNRKKMGITYLRAIPKIEMEAAELGTLWFGIKYPILGSKRKQNAQPQ